MLKTKSDGYTGVVAWPYLEESLGKWILKQPEKGHHISTVEICIQAKNMAQQMELKVFICGPERKIIKYAVLEVWGDIG